MTVITISRQYASGGDQIAHRVSRLLQYRYFDKLLVADLARETGQASGRPVDFSEDQYRMPRLIDRLLNRPSPPSGKVSGTRAESAEEAGKREKPELDAEAAIKLTRAAIEAAYERGRVVIVGRGGQAVLQGKPGVLHVRIEAPLEWRIDRLREVEDYTRYAAKEVILEHDRNTADYVKRFYGVNWADSSLYHMVINAEPWGIPGATQLIVAAVKGLRSPGEPAEGNGETVSRH